jgi:hypothetical protein
LAAQEISPADSVVVAEALLAELSGWGGCRTVEQFRPYSSRFFSSVVLIEGFCTAEHGQARTALVGIDGENVIYLLDSPSALNFLILRHTPRVAHDDVISYAVEALGMMGHAPWGARLATTISDIPPNRRTLLGIDDAELRPSIFHQTSGATLLALTLVSDVQISRFEITVTPTGRVSISRRLDLWTEPSFLH